LVEPKQEKRVPARPVAGIRPRRWATRRSTEDFANINGFSTMGFIVLMTLSTHGHGMTFQERRLGFPKRPCFPKFMKMVAHGAPVTDGLDVKTPKDTKKSRVVATTNNSKFESS
jgi:hypothetical protein